MTSGAARHELTLHGLTHGAEAVGRLPSGKVCFVPHAVPGERVVVEVSEERSKWARGRLVEVLEASADRVQPPCPYAGAETPGAPPRCGGCLLQHVAPARQAAMRRRIVTEQLERIGRFTDPPIDDTVVVAPLGYRSHPRFAVDPAGRLGFRRLRTHEVVPIDRCLRLDERAQALREEAGDGWQGVQEVTVHAGARGRALLVRPGRGGLPPLPGGDAAVALLGAGKPADLRGRSTVEGVVTPRPRRASRPPHAPSAVPRRTGGTRRRSCSAFGCSPRDRFPRPHWRAVAPSPPCRRRGSSPRSPWTRKFLMVKKPFSRKYQYATSSAVSPTV